MTSISSILNKKKQQVDDRKAGSKNAYKFKPGKTTMRILPSWRKTMIEDENGNKVPDPTFFHDFGLTWVKDMDGNVLATVADAQITYGKADPVRSLVQKALGGARTDAQREHYKEMLAKPRVLVNAQILDDKNVDPNVAEMVELSEAQFTNLISQVQAQEIEEEFLDLENGVDLVVERTGSGFDTRYTFVFKRKPRAVDPAIMDTLPDIDAYIRAKFAESEKAVNAIKSLTQGEAVLAISDNTTSYSGNDDSTVDADYDVVDEASIIDVDNINMDTETTSDDDIAALFGDDD